MALSPTDSLAAFEEGLQQRCADQRKDWPLPSAALISDAGSGPQQLREFIWKPPEEMALTRTGAAIDALLSSLRASASDEPTRVFLQLMEDPPYAATLRQGFDNGYKDGR